MYFYRVRPAVALLDTLIFGSATAEGTSLSKNL